MNDGTGQVTITLKDVYQATQTLERSLSDSLGTLNLTMVSIKGHLEQLDTRNAAADELHKEQGERLRKLETAVESAKLPSTLPDYEVRLRALERFKYTLLGAVLVVNTLIALAEYALTHKGA